MNAEVRPGYKLTEAGVIPEDWQLCQLSEIANLERGKFSARPRNDPRFFGGDTPFIQTGDVSNSDGYIKTYSQTLNETGLGVSKLFPKGTIFFTIAANIGDIAFADFDSACPDSLIGIRPNTNTDRYWLFHALNYRKKIFEGLATQNAQLNINLEKLRPYTLALPPFSEQQAIATALSDLDALTSSLDQLIAKKRDIKQAAMQQLLSGQKRLPGFKTAWIQVKAGDIGKFRGGSGFPVKNQGETEGDYPFFKVSDMNNEGNDVFMSNANNFVSESARRIIGATLFPEKCVVFAKVGAAVFLERKKILAKESCLDNNMTAFIFDTAKLNSRFVHYMFQNIRLGDLVSTTALPSLSGSVLSSIEMGLPSFEEQTAIATLLSDMDAELAALEQRRDKAKLLKQGMMQELLTGRIRLL